MANRSSQICWASLPAAALRRVLELVPVTQRVGSLHSCALVCSSWSKEAPAATVELTYPDPCDNTESLQRYLDSHGTSLQTLELRLDDPEGTGLSRLPCPMLRSLELRWLHNSIADLSLLNSISAATHLTSLSLFNALVEPQLDLAALLRPLTKLQHFVANPAAVRDGCHRDWIELPAVHHLQHLTCLMYMGTITDASLQHIGALRQLQHLDLCFTDGSQCTTAAANGLCQLEQLTELAMYDLSGSGAIDSNPAVLPDFSGTTSTARLTALQKLNILFTYSRFPPVLLAGMTGLTSLDMRIPWKEQDGAAELLAALSPLSKLKNLGLYDLDATAVPASACTAITASSNLTHLSLQGCRLPPPAWLEVFSPMRKLTQLQDLDINGGVLREEDGHAAWEALVCCCPNLHKLDVCLVGMVKVSTALLQLSLLTHLTASASTDAMCGVLAQLTSLRALAAQCLEGVTLAGVRQLAALTQLTMLQLEFRNGLEEVFPQQDADYTEHPCWESLGLEPHWTAFSTTPDGDVTFDVWLQLLMACTQAAHPLPAEDSPSSASLQGFSEGSDDEPEGGYYEGGYSFAFLNSL